ncbi:MAG: carboxypeptidase-like regulatory domain-containing protein, partial [Gemmatimonadota bacterium]
MTAGFWILAGLALQAGPGSVPGTVRGVVRDASDGHPLSDALVTLVRDERTAITDRNGVYVFRDVAPGERRVRASRIGFQSLEVSLDLPDGSTLQVDFLLTLQPIEMPTVEARASPLYTVDTLVSEPEPVAIGAAVVRLLDVTPGVAEPGLAAAANVLLGPDPPAPDNVLFVRGAGAALDLILLDGAPVQAPFHLGGLIQPSVSPSIVHAARLQGGVSARWDGGLSDVLLLDSRAGSGSGAPARGTLYVDML